MSAASPVRVADAVQSGLQVLALAGASFGLAVSAAHVPQPPLASKPFPPRLGRKFADGADVVDYLTEIPLPGQRLAVPRTAATDRRAEFVSPAFVVGPENRLVADTFHRLLDGTRDHASPQFMPGVLALFGPSGTGKTHLARGLVGHWQTQRGAETAAYVTAIDFRRLYTAAIREDAVADFRRQFRSPQLLAIDDLNQLPADDYLTQELRYTLDELEEEGNTVVVTSNRPVSTLANLSADLRSRLSAGLMLHLAVPGADARVRIIQQTSTALGEPLADDITRQLATSVSGDATDLIGALFELCSAPSPRASNDRTRTEMFLVKRAARRPSLREIVAVVAKYTRVPQKQLKSGSRKQSIVFARGLIVYLARELCAASYHEIGRALGGRDHTTIMHSYQKITGEKLHNPATQEVIDDLQRTLATR